MGLGVVVGGISVTLRRRQRLYTPFNTFIFSMQ